MDELVKQFVLFGAPWTFDPIHIFLYSSSTSMSCHGRYSEKHVKIVEVFCMEYGGGGGGGGGFI